MEAKEKIRSYITDNFLFGATEKAFGDEDSFLETGIIDSTGILELVSFLEEEFGLDVKDDELVPDNLDSVNRLLGYISKKQNN